MKIPAAEQQIEIEIEEVQMQIQIYTTWMFWANRRKPKFRYQQKEEAVQLEL